MPVYPRPPCHDTVTDLVRRVIQSATFWHSQISTLIRQQAVMTDKNGQLIIWSSAAGRQSETSGQQGSHNITTFNHRQLPDILLEF